MRPERKGQVTTELIIMSAVVFILFLFIAVIINQKNTQVIGYKRYLSAKDVGDQAAFTINQVYITGYGASNFFYVPASLSDGTSFNMTIYPSAREVVVEWGQQQYIAPLLTSDIAGNLTLLDGRVEVTNNVGEIDVSE